MPPPDFLPYLQRRVETDKPVIAAVNGVAFAGGFLLAQMPDVVVADDHGSAFEEKRKPQWQGR